MPRFPQLSRNAAYGVDLRTQAGRQSLRSWLGGSHGGVCRPAFRIEETISYHAKAQQDRVYFGAESYEWLDSSQV